MVECTWSAGGMTPTASGTQSLMRLPTSSDRSLRGSFGSVSPPVTCPAGRRVATPLTIVRDAKDLLSAGGSANRFEDSPLQQPRSRARLEDSPTKYPRHKTLMHLRR